MLILVPCFDAVDHDETLTVTLNDVEAPDPSSGDPADDRTVTVDTTVDPGTGAVANVGTGTIQDNDTATVTMPGNEASPFKLRKTATGWLITKFPQ